MTLGQFEAGDTVTIDGTQWKVNCVLDGGYFMVQQPEGWLRRFSPETEVQDYSWEV